MPELMNTIMADGPSSNPAQPIKAQMRAWGTWAEGIITAFLSSGGLIYSSKASLDADLAHAANSMAWVIGDATVANNGIYRKLLGSGLGSWTRVADLPYSYIQATDAGAGTPNAIIATSSVPLPAADAGALIAFNVFEANTASPVTVAFNGGAALTIKTSSGNNVVAGGLTAGMVVAGYKSGTTFRLLSDQASAAIQAAAEAAAEAAAASAAAAAASASSINLPAPVALTFLQRNAGNTAYDVKTVPEVRNALSAPLSVASLAALKAVDTTKDTVASYDGYFWDWSLGDSSAEVTADGTYATVKANAIASTVGAWVRRIQQPVPATVFGGFTGTALQAAVNYMSRKGGGEVYLPSGSANSLAAQVTVPTKVSIRGGKGSSITPSVAMTSLLLVQAGLTAVRGIRIENSGGLATRGVEVNKAFNNAKVVIEDNYFSNFTDAVRWTDGDCLHFLGNEVISNANAVYVANNCMNSHFERNYILGGSGYSFNKTTQGVEGANIDGDVILPGPGGLPAMTFNCALDVQIKGCILDQLYGASGVNIIATTNPISGVKFLNNWLGRNLGASGANYGLYVEGGARNVQSAFNTYTGWQQAGIYFKGASGAPTRDCASINDNFYYADRCLRDILIDWSSDLLIDGNTFNGSGASIVESAGTITGRVINCNYLGSVIPSSITGGLRYGLQRAGITLRNKGTATLAQTTRVATITHGLSYAPTLQDISMQTSGFAVNAPGELVADTLGATTFRGVCRNDPGAGGQPIVWVADLTR